MRRGMAPLAIRCLPPFLSKHSRNIYNVEFQLSSSTFLDTFRRFYGPTMNAFEAADCGGRTNDL